MEKKLMQLKERIDKAEKELQHLEGQKQQLLQQLKEEFGFFNIDEANKGLLVMQKDLETLENQIDKEYNSIIERYDRI